jgi:tetratricopeptide (TPR) repeat protein
MADSYFTLLGINENSSEQELKSAFLMKVREFPPHKHPAQYKKLRQAYECLNSSEERKKYVANLNSGGQISELQEKINSSFELENWKDVISLCKRIIVIDSDNLSVRNQLGLAHNNAGNNDDAHKVFQRLNSFEHNVSLYYYNHGSILLDLAATTDQSHYLSDAERQFKIATEIEPEASASYLGLARVCFDRGQIDKGLTYCREAIDADGETDFQDFDAFYLMCQWLAISEKSHKFHSTIKEMESILTPEIAEYAASLFAQQAIIAVNDLHNVEMARLFSKASTDFLKWFDISNSDLKELHSEIVDLHKLAKESDKISKRSDVLVAVQQLVNVKFLVRLGALEEYKAKEHLQQIAEALDTWPVDEVRRSFQYLKNNCKQSYKEMKEYVDKTLELCGGTSYQSSHRSQPQSHQPAESGCLVFFVILAVGFAALKTL